MRTIKIGDCVQHQDDGSFWILDFHFELQSGLYEAKNANKHRHVIIDQCDYIPTLHLPIKGKWFDMILSGQKKEEYRDIAGAKKSYRNVGLLTSCRSSLAAHEADNFGEVYFNRLLKSGQFKVKPWKVLHLTHGYGHHLPQLWADIKEIEIGKGNPEWGAPAEDVFIIRLGEVFHTKNLK